MSTRTTHSRTNTQRTSGQVWLGVQERAEREERHRAADLARPAWGDGADGSPRSANLGRAAREDQNMRERWGYKLKSAYTLMIDVPDIVAARDYATAGAILRRIEGALDVRFRWTESERVRLRNLRDAWAVRARGRDIKFNIRGWQRKVTLSAYEQKREAELARFTALMTEMESTINGEQQPELPQS